jgi:sugar O-acyltransferase (sialic acid O-acetyltransferase NeuD family)
MNDLVIFGAGGVGRQVAQIVFDLNNVKPTWNLIGFIDDDISNIHKQIEGLPIIGNHLWLEKHRKIYVAVAIGKPSLRSKAYKRLNKIHHNFIASIIHPSSWLGDRVKIGKGSVIYANSVLDPDVNIGTGNIINKNCTVGHDSIFRDFVTLAPGVNIAGQVEIGCGCDFGINSAVIQNICIGEWSIIGGGAVVIKDLPARVVAVGVPAKIIRTHK